MRKFCSGQVERDHVDHLVVGEPLALERRHLLGDRDGAEGELDAERAAAALRALDEDLGVLLGLRVPVAVEGLDHRAAAVDVELAHLVGAAEVEVHRAGMDGAEGALGLDRAEQLARTSASRTATESADAERSEIRPAGKPGPRGTKLSPRPRRSSPRRDEALGALAPARPQHLVVSVDQPARRRPAAPRRRPRAGAASGSAPTRGRGSRPRPGARGTPRDGGRRTGRERPGPRRRARGRCAGVPPGPTSGAGWRPCRGTSRRSPRRARRCRFPARARRSRRRRAARRAPAPPRSRAAAAACSRRGRARSAPRARGARRPSASSARSAGSARSRGGCA